MNSQLGDEPVNTIAFDKYSCRHFAFTATKGNYAWAFTKHWKFWKFFTQKNKWILPFQMALSLRHCFDSSLLQEDYQDDWLDELCGLLSLPSPHTILSLQRTIRHHLLLWYIHFTDNSYVGGIHSNGKD